MNLSNFTTDEIVVLRWLQNIAKKPDQDIYLAWTNLGCSTWNNWIEALSALSKNPSFPIDWLAIRKIASNAGYLDHLDPSLSDKESEEKRKETAGARRQYVLDCIIAQNILFLIDETNAV
jgi:hypothetical protein